MFVVQIALCLHSDYYECHYDVQTSWKLSENDFNHDEDQITGQHLASIHSGNDDKIVESKFHYFSSLPAHSPLCRTHFADILLGPGVACGVHSISFPGAML